MKNFEINRTKGIIAFKNTDELSNQINDIISALRKRTASINPKLGKYVKSKTPGKNKVKLAVQLALKNNAFNYYKGEFQYQGKLGATTRLINSKINSKLRQTLPKSTEIAEAAIRMLTVKLLHKSNIPGFIIDKTASAIAHGVIVGLSESGNSPSASRADINEATAFAKQAALSTIEVANQLKRSPPDVQRYFVIESERNLIKFEHTDEIAVNINKLIKELRQQSSTIPYIGSDLSKYIKKKTPGPNAVKHGIKHTLRNNAFNYKTMHFESLGNKIGSTHFINKKINKSIDAQFTSAMLKMEALIRHTYSLALANSFLGRLPDGRLKEQLVNQLAEKIFEFAATTIEET